ncbi:hypothetical protein CEXT_476201 [Caerostris extrusa]|uniref:Uncharacterized protein n=1 Tax=Caerostris extrusa TaxID=172846 RepID=A0AAV4WAT0_CAEEX|nr:hypothetical protein CEXT_476201 [Caerostris extrusa]
MPLPLGCLRKSLSIAAIEKVKRLTVNQTVRDAANHWLQTNHRVLYEKYAKMVTPSGTFQKTGSFIGGDRIGEV